MEIKKPDQIIDEQFTEFSGKFRPEFGNQKHISIVQQIQKISDIEKVIRKKESDALGAKKLRDELIQLKRHAVFMFKNL